MHEMDYFQNIIEPKWAPNFPKLRKDKQISDDTRIWRKKNESEIIPTSALLPQEKEKKTV